MKVSGFSFIRNALKYDYPIVEAITSILPVCDEFIIAVGKSDDETLQLIEAINSPKIKILHTDWDDALREGGRVLAVETDKALQAVAQDSDWAFYIQGDEVVHEQDLPAIREAMLKWKDTPKVDGLLFKYKHFYGSYQYIGNSRRWYRHEIRIVRPRIGVFSYRDAQGFRILPNQKLRVKPIDASIYHYGWVKPPKYQLQKRIEFHKLWHQSEIITTQEDYDYHDIDSLALFTGMHPAVMATRLERLNWEFEYDTSKRNLTFRNYLLQTIYNLTGVWLFEYRNYRRV